MDRNFARAVDRLALPVNLVVFAACAVLAFARNLEGLFMRSMASTC